MSHLEVRRVRILDVGPVDLAVGAGECVVLRGPSGAGKTLLLRAIADLSPHEGEVRLGEREQTAVPAPEWRRRVGYLPAESGWWAPLVGDHFDEAPDLAAVGFGPETLGWDVSRLSTGERQRLALLRLLMNEPDALLLDEPTANLDADATALVEDLVAGYRAEHTAPVLWVAHDRAQGERIAARRFRIDAGKVAPE